MMTFRERMQGERRLAILRLLAEAPGYSANQHLLYAALPAQGLNGSSDQVGADLAWLAEVGLVETESVIGVTIAKVTQRGLDVAAGVANVPGVARPGP